MDIVKNPNHKFMEQNLSVVIERILPIGFGMSDHIKVYLSISFYVYANSSRNLIP